MTAFFVHAPGWAYAGTFYGRNAAEARAAARKWLGVGRLPAGTAVWAACPLEPQYGPPARWNRSMGGMTAPRLFISASVRRGLDAIGAGMLDHACPDQRAAIAWARALPESLTAPAAQGRRVSRANAASAQRERRINKA